MADFVSTLAVTLQDRFSKPIQNIQKGLGAFRSNLDTIGEGLNLSQLSEGFSSAASYLGSLDDVFAGAAETPRELAGAYDSGFTQIAGVLNETKAIGNEARLSMDTIGGAAQSLAASVLGAGKLAGIGIDEFAAGAYTIQSAGLMTEQAAAALQSGDTSLAGFTGVLQTLGTDIDSVTTRALEFVTSVPGLSEGISTLSGLASSALSFGQGILEGMETVTEMANVVDGFISTAKGLGPAFMKALGPIQAFGGGIVKTISLMFSWAVANWAALWPILLIILGVAALIAIVVLVIKHWSVIGAFFKNLWEGIKNSFASAWEWIKGVLSVAWEWIQGVFQTAADVLLWIMAPIPRLIITYWEPISQFFVDLWEGIKTTFASAWAWIQELFSGVSAFIGGIFEKITAPFKAIGNFFGKLFGDGKKAGSDFVDTMAEGVAGNQALDSAIANQFSYSGELLPRSDAKRGPFSNLTDAGRSIPKTMAEGIQQEDRTLAHRLEHILHTPKTAPENRNMSSQRALPGRITIEKLVVQADEFEDLAGFVRMLETATAYTRSYA